MRVSAKVKVSRVAMVPQEAEASLLTLRSQGDFLLEVGREGPVELKRKASKTKATADVKALIGEIVWQLWSAPSSPYE